MKNTKHRLLFPLLLIILSLCCSCSFEPTEAVDIIESEITYNTYINDFGVDFKIEDGALYLKGENIDCFFEDSSSVSRVFTTRLRWGVLYFFRMVVTSFLAA